MFGTESDTRKKLKTFKLKEIIDTAVDDINLNYKPSREYNWRKNFRLDDEDSNPTTSNNNMLDEWDDQVTENTGDLAVQMHNVAEDTNEQFIDTVSIYSSKENEEGKQQLDNNSNYHVGIKENQVMPFHNNKLGEWDDQITEDTEDLAVQAHKVAEDMSEQLEDTASIYSSDENEESNEELNNNSDYRIGTKENHVIDDKISYKETELKEEWEEHGIENDFKADIMQQQGNSSNRHDEHEETTNMFEEDDVKKDEQNHFIDESREKQNLNEYSKDEFSTNIKSNDENIDKKEANKTVYAVPQVPLEHNLNFDNRKELLRDISDFYDFLRVEAIYNRQNSEMELKHSAINASESTCIEQEIEVRRVSEITIEPIDTVKNYNNMESEEVTEDNFDEDTIQKSSSASSKVEQNTIDSFDMIKDANFYPLF